MAAVQSSIWVPPPTINGNGCGPAHGHPETLVLSEPGHLDLRLYRGDSGRFTVRVQYPDGTPIDVRGAVWDCDVRAYVGQEPQLATLQVLEVAGVPHEVEVIITAENSIWICDGIPPGDMGVWDLEMVLGGETMTILRGHVCCIDDVSRPVTS